MHSAAGGRSSKNACPPLADSPATLFGGFTYLQNINFLSNLKNPR
jgi:hypothetical protein